MADKRQDRPTWYRWSGIGFEFAAAVLGLTLLGFWIDRRFDTAPWGVIVGAALGLTGGTYNLIRESLTAVREAERDAARRRREDHPPPDDG